MTSILNTRDFVRELIQHFSDDVNMELDYCDFTELAEKHGLIRWEDYDPEKHGDMDAEEGDRVWVPNDVRPLCCLACGFPMAAKQIGEKYFAYCECLREKK